MAETPGQPLTRRPTPAVLQLMAAERAAHPAQVDAVRIPAKARAAERPVAVRVVQVKVQAPAA
jgi:hypothetical protein